MGIKISQLSVASTINGAEYLPLDQSATTKKTTIEDFLKKPIFGPIDLSISDYVISSYGLYYVTTGSTEFSPYGIILPDPSVNEGMEVMIFNYDQTLTAFFGGSYIPYRECSNSYAEQLGSIAPQRTVLLIAVNGYWNACTFKA
jgi:hypothetical protein